jgi:hypothetical protein
LPAAGDGGDNAAVELLIEREREADELGGVIEPAVAGNGGALLVEGEAGIGKTRLLAMARGGAAGAGARVLHASSDETEAGVPLAAARALFARASRGVEMEGPARLGALALRGALETASETLGLDRVPACRTSAGITKASAAGRIVLKNASRRHFSRRAALPHVISARPSTARCAIRPRRG